MINLAGKSVFVRTQTEYENILKNAKLQRFSWSSTVDYLDLKEIPVPNILNFYSNGVVTFLTSKDKVYEASEIVVQNEKLEEAINLVRTFAKYPDRTALTDTFIESLRLLADAVEGQMEEVK